jgi:hypothetical protein
VERQIAVSRSPSTSRCRTPTALAWLQYMHQWGREWGVDTAAIGYKLIEGQRSLRRRRAGATQSGGNDARVWRDGVAAPVPAKVANRNLGSDQAGVVGDEAACTPPHPSARLPLSSAAQHNAPTRQAALPPPVLARSTREPAHPPIEWAADPTLQGEAVGRAARTSQKGS